MKLNNFKIESGFNASKASDSPKQEELPRHKKGEKFLKGPIPWDWILCAANLSGSALKVTIALWHLAAMKGNRTVKLSNKLMLEMKVNRSTKYNALKGMEKAGLVSIKSTPGSSPEVTLLYFHVKE